MIVGRRDDDHEAPRVGTMRSGSRSAFAITRSRVGRAALLGVVLLALGACESPEAARSRGGDPGADVGNHGRVLEFHGGNQPFYGTPLKGAGR